jgi:chromosomal replication initiator protein
MGTSRQGENSLNNGHIFDSFAVGNSNRSAYAASVAVSESPGKAYNPLFIWGGVGLGKTHLMHAIAHRLKRGMADTRVIYITAENFINGLVSSIRNGSAAEFRELYRNLDALLVDDVQYLSGKDSTQEEFMYAFDSLYEAGKQIVISSALPPKEIAGVGEHLASRLARGLVISIQLPDTDTRAAILRKKAEVSGFDLPENVILYLAQHIPGNIMEMEGTLNRVIHRAKTNTAPINEEDLGILLGELFERAPGRGG